MATHQMSKKRKVSKMALSLQMVKLRKTMGDIVAFCKPYELRSSRPSSLHFLKHGSSILALADDHT
ncbi:hypothetical protein Fmac_006117 [Flemingia macrophylla]|uniref:Uncharacterized protein n=1 Tax=Flemingia macrophylla TaxID=520843 RepID=A0ABD1N9Q4_9FABA